MHDLAFVSGPWTGFYTYAKIPGQHPMELQLVFKDGILSGDGTDDIGPFSIQGTYNAATGSARWIKSYTGSHEVHYQGILGGTGLQGIWKTLPAGQGTFRLWPRQLGNGEHS